MGIFNNYYLNFLFQLETEENKKLKNNDSIMENKQLREEKEIF